MDINNFNKKRKYLNWYFSSAIASQNKIHKSRKEMFGRSLSFTLGTRMSAQIKLAWTYMAISLTVLLYLYTRTKLPKFFQIFHYAKLVSIKSEAFGQIANYKVIPVLKKSI